MDIKTIGKHINNSLSEELLGLAVVAKFATTDAGPTEAQQQQTYATKWDTSTAFLLTFIGR